MSLDDRCPSLTLPICLHRYGLYFVRLYYCIFICICIFAHLCAVCRLVLDWWLPVRSTQLAGPENQHLVILIIEIIEIKIS